MNEKEETYLKKRRELENTIKELELDMADKETEMLLLSFQSQRAKNKYRRLKFNFANEKNGDIKKYAPPADE